VHRLFDFNLTKLFNNTLPVLVRNVIFMNNAASLPADYVKDLQRTIDFYSDEALQPIIQFGLQHATDTTSECVETKSFARIRHMVYTNWLALAMATCKYSQQLTPIAKQLWQPAALPKLYQEFAKSLQDFAKNPVEFMRTFYYETIIHTVNYRAKPVESVTLVGAINTKSFNYKSTEDSHFLDVSVGSNKASMNWAEKDDVMHIQHQGNPERFAPHIADALLYKARTISSCTTIEVTSQTPDHWQKHGFTMCEADLQFPMHYTLRLHTNAKPILQPVAEIFHTSPTQTDTQMIVELEHALESNSTLDEWFQKQLPTDTAHVLGSRIYTYHYQRHTYAKRSTKPNYHP
jgi:hypothetical protein